jgi:hypothetical protein
MNQTVLALCLSAIFMTPACKDSSTNNDDNTTDNTKIYKYTGAEQCEPDSGVPLDVMQMELANAGIDVLCAQLGNDGNAYPTVCGGATGDINVYLIRRVNLPDAEDLGFSSVLTLPDYRDRACPQP